MNEDNFFENVGHVAQLRENGQKNNYASVFLRMRIIKTQKKSAEHGPFKPKRSDLKRNTSTMGKK